MRSKIVSLLVAGFSLGVVQAASAADMPTKAPMAAPAVPFGWSGIYFGGSVGGAWGSRDFVYAVGTFPAPNPANFTASVVGGGFLGAQWQWNSLVLGAEATFQGMSLKNTEACPNPTFNCVTSANQFWTVGPRVGWSLGQFMVYGTGGYASMKTKYEADFVAGGATLDSGSSWNHGWFAGGGADWMIPGIPGLILGVDYKHVRANSATVIPATPAGAPSPGDQYTMSAKADVIQARLSYLWNWTGH
jgi:outer membrane immunogenic protein